MNENNLEYLEKQIAYTGFGDIKKADLMEMMMKGKQEFSLPFSKEIGKDLVTGQLNFAKPEKPLVLQDDMYFFNSYDLQLKKEGTENTLDQNFRVSYGNTYTLREAYNMMHGRSVNKDFISVNKENRDEDKSYNAWAYIDFKTTIENGSFKIKKNFNFDLEKALLKLPIKNIENENVRIDLMDNLKRGNYQMVKFVVNGQEEKHYIDAAARYGSINIYDENMKRQFLSTTETRQQNTPENNIENKQEDIPQNKQENTQENIVGNKQEDTAQNKEESNLEKGQGDKQEKVSENNLETKQENIQGNKQENVPESKQENKQENYQSNKQGAKKGQERKLGVNKGKTRRQRRAG